MRDYTDLVVYACYMQSVNVAASTGRRPTGRYGPARDPKLDFRILDAAVELLAEGGFAHLTMEGAAQRAKVGKATVYRRWPTPADLAAEAFEHSGLVNELAVVSLGPGQVREELIATLGAPAHCKTRHSQGRLVATMMETARLHPEVGQAVQQRYLTNLFDSISAVVLHACERGDLPPASAQLAAQRPIQIEAAVALILQWQCVRDRDISDSEIALIVDTLIIPAFR